ncbi:MAG TPA: glycosyltransferase family 9 protein [Candidatus Eremiobacteraeota bacterium]|nr:MAG: Lipopolysaccharide core heptosyltransferase RfaQ [bacterium ADurb.Bin363]HPZ06966.1 glycosyltransferase family 9 protein [Candidatus Eremiobacteraeota bacterium]
MFPVHLIMLHRKSSSHPIMKRMLVILTHGGIGDIILATPVLKSLKEELSLEYLAILVSSYTEDIIRDNPYLDEILIDVDPQDKNKRAPFFHLLRKIKSYNFDGAILLWSTARFAWLIYLAGIPVRVGQDFRLLYSFLYTHRVPLRSLLGDRESHWVECLMDFPRQIGAGRLEPELCLPIREIYKKEIEELLEGKGISKKNLLIGFHPGRGLDITDVNWPYENFAQIGDAIQTELKVHLVLTGGEKEKELIGRIEGSMKTSPVNMAGKLSLMHLAALINRCNVFISMDSGPMHMASACKTPVIAIFALKSDLPPRWKPYKTKHVIVRKDVSCTDKCIKEKCRHFSCLHELSVQDILEPLKGLLKNDEQRNS